MINLKYPPKSFIKLLKKTSRGPYGIIIGTTILFYCFYRIGFNDIFKSFSEAKPQFVLSACIILFCWVAQGALNIKIMLRPLATPKFITIFRYYCKANMLALITPGQVGDAILISFFKQLSIPIVQGVTIFTLDKFITLFWYIFFALYGCYLLDNSLWNFAVKKEHLSFTPTILFSLIILIAVFSIISHLLLSNVLKERIQNWFRLVTEYLYKGKKAVFLDWCSTFIRTLLLGSIYWFMIQSFGPTPDFLPTLCFSIMGGMVAYIPISFNGLGTVEASQIFLFSAIGVEAAPILAAMISLRVIMIITLSFGIILSNHWIKKNSTKQQVEKHQKDKQIIL